MLCIRADALGLQIAEKEFVVTDFVTSAFSGQLFVRYTHVVGLPREIHANSPMMPVDRIDPKTHAQAAPEEAEWFQYFRSNEAGVHSPVDDAPVYFLDTTPEDTSQYGIQHVSMRRSCMYMPFYPAQPYRNAVISSLGE